jgi:cholest-4-en-3-one 26-monooxygenase
MPDLFGDAGLYADGPPHALFAELRRESPVLRTPNPHGGHVWSLFKHADVAAVSKDPGTFSSYERGIFLQPDQVMPLEVNRNVLLYKDPPEHTKYRTILQQFFSPRAVAQLTELVERTVTEALDAVDGECDFVADIAAPIPLRVLTRLMGVPDDDVPSFSAWTEQIEAAQRSLEPSRAVDTFGAMAGYLHETIQAQLGAGADTLVRRLHDAEVDGESLDDAELLTFFALLAFAGNDTTRNTAATGMLTLLEHPEAMAQLRADEGALPAAVEEILRHTSVVQWFARTATQDTEIRGQAIAAGDLVVLWYGSASRDEEVFADPDVFDLARGSTAHHAFGGGGRHFCLGNQLARLELRVLYREVLRRMPGLALAGPVERLGSSWANALTKMPVRW